jgi:phosphoenolpyruvate carboxykinase (ATP)
MGVDKPTTISSPCFGEPFLVWQPLKYANLLEEKIEKHNPNVWLLNTGWYKGGYGKGQRMPLKITRRIVELIMSEEILTKEFEVFPNLNLEVPKKLDDNIDENILFPNKNWENEDEYWEKLNELIALFDEKYEKIINL